MSDNRTCLDCARWRWSHGDPGYSEYTPGWDATMGCGKRHWKLGMFSDQRGDVRDKLKMAVICSDFTPDTTP